MESSLGGLKAILLLYMVFLVEYRVGSHIGKRLSVGRRYIIRDIYNQVQNVLGQKNSCDKGIYKYD